MKQCRSRAVLAASLAAAVGLIPLGILSAPTTQPSTAESAPALATTRAVGVTRPLSTAPATTEAAVGAAATQAASTQAASMQAASTQTASTQAASTQAAATQPAATQFAATNPAATQEASTQPFDADHPPATIRLNFRDTPIDVILEHLSQDAGFSVIKEASADARVTVMSMQPLTPAQAVTLLNAVLKGDGLAAVQDGRTLRIVSREKAKRGNLPVQFGADPADIEPGDGFVTQVIPIHNVDAVKLRQDLMPLIGPDADVASNSGANAVVMTDTASNVRRIVQIISLLDKREGTTSEVKIIHLKNASAGPVARLVLSIFRPPEPKLQKGQQAPPPEPNIQRESRLLGTGVDQALYGGKVTAGADERTNSVVIAAPVEALKAIEAMIKEIDADPTTAATPSIKSFHLKIADATAVAHAIRNTFRAYDDPQPGQSHQTASEDSLQSRVTVVAEERTNTLIVTAPPAAMAVVESLIRDVDSAPAVETTVRSYQLKFADAVTSAKVLLSVFIDPNTGGSRLQTGSRDKVGVTADTRTNTVFVTAPKEDFELVEKTVKELDANPTAGADVRFFHLKQADSDATAKLILNFFNPQPIPGTEKHLTDAVHVGVNAVSDPRTNTVGVTAPPEAMKTVEKIILEVENAPTLAFDIESFPLKNADASNAAKLLSTVFQPDPPSGNSGVKETGKEFAVKAKVVAASDDRTNTVIVTAPADTLKVIEGVIKLLDANPLAGAEIQVFTLLNADAERAGKLLESIFQPPSLTGTTSGGGSGSSSAPGAPKPPGTIDAVRKLGWITTASDDRTNTLIVTASEQTMKMVGGIVRQLDSNPISQETFFIYRLRNGQSQDMETVLNELFGNTQLGGANGNQQQRNSTQQQPSNQQAGANPGRSGLGSSSFGGSSFTGSSTTSGAGGTGIGARRGTVTTGTGAPATGQLSAGMQRVATELTGQVFVVADPDTNSLLVTTAVRYQREVRDIIAELDRSVPQVLIKVLVAEVTHDSSADWGLDFSVLNSRASGKGTITAQNLGNAAAGMANGGLVVSMLESQVNATLHALATEGKLDVLSRPYILASDNQLASITVGQEVPFITNTQITDTGQQINTIQYQDIGIILNVTPHINPEGLVILDVAPEISQLTGTTVPISAGVAAPIIAKRSAMSRVGIKNGQTIVIGGLMQDSKTVTISKVPLVGDIPILGELFRRTQIAKSKTELLIFLTPHVAQQPETLDPMTHDEMNGTKLTPNAVEPGMFQDHMKGMKRGDIPETRPTSRPSDTIIEFTHPTTLPGEIAPQPSGPIRLP
ncbi:MAG TPA: secretin N-terminal domain-containing protein [Tepidisphaeraceae bacterium]|jgi:general secretion pathway protein D|nr:secretin N-terminal domain-containing protein [Tepidisphaeraceae bacterium]